MPTSILRLVAAVLAGTFAWAAAAKAARPGAWARALEGYRLPRVAGTVAAVAVPAAEASAAGLLLAGATHAGAAVIVALLAAFSGAVFRAHALRGDRLPCGCFGARSERDYRVMLARNGALAVLAAVLLLAGRDVALVGAMALPHRDEVVAAVLVAVGVALCAWMVWGVGSAIGRKSRT